jgi:hypothetical protein
VQDQLHSASTKAAARASEWPLRRQGSISDEECRATTQRLWAHAPACKLNASGLSPNGYWRPISALRGSDNAASRPLYQGVTPNPDIEKGHKTYHPIYLGPAEHIAPRTSPQGRPLKRGSEASRGPMGPSLKTCVCEINAHPNPINL